MEGSTVSRRVREAREQANLTRQQLAAELGVTEAAIRHWESGNRHPRHTYLVALARATGRSVAWFYEEAA